MESDNSSETVNRRRYLKLVGGTGFAVALAGCAGDGGGDGNGDGGNGDETTTTTEEVDEDAVILGQPAALTGKWDYLQEATTAVSEMVIEDINAAGGPLDREFVLRQRDTAVESSQARTVFQQLVNVDGAAAINGGFSSTLIPIWDLIQDLEVPVVTPWPGTRALDDQGGDKGTPDDVSDDEWVWRTIISDSVHTAGAALRANEIGDTAGIIHGASEGETSWADGFEDAAGVIDGLDVVERVEVEEGKNSYRTEVDRLFQTDFDVWALSLALEDAVTLMKNWDQGGYGRPVIGQDTLSNSDFYEALGDVLEGQEVSVAEPGTGGESYDEVVSQFNEAFPDVGTHPWAIANFDAVNVIALAIHRAGTDDPVEVQKNIGPVARPPGTEVTTFEEGKAALDNGDEINFEGAVTNVDFTDYGEVVGPTRIMKVNPTDVEELTVIESEEIREILTDPSYGQ